MTKLTLSVTANDIVVEDARHPVLLLLLGPLFKDRGH